MLCVVLSQQRSGGGRGGKSTRVGKSTRGGRSKAPARRTVSGVGGGGGGGGGRGAKGAAAAAAAVGDAKPPPRAVSHAIVLRERILVWDSTTQRFVFCVLCIVSI